MNLQISFSAASTVPGRVFGLDLQTIIQIGFQLFNAIFLTVVLSLILYKPVRNFLHDRTNKIKSQLDTAVSDMAKANELKSQYEQKLRDIESERNEILDSARKIATEKSRLMLSETQSQADAIREQAAIDVKLEKERAKDEIKRDIIEVATAMTEKILVCTIDKDTHDRLFSETLAELEEMTWRN